MKKLIALLAAFITVTAFTSALAEPQMGTGAFRTANVITTPGS